MKTSALNHADKLRQHEYRKITDRGFESIRLHDLRHTQATLLLKNGEDILTVFQRLGHTKVSTALDVYGHVLPGVDKEAADLFGSVGAWAGKE